MKPRTAGIFALFLCGVYVIFFCFLPVKEPNSEFALAFGYRIEIMWFSFALIGATMLLILVNLWLDISGDVFDFIFQFTFISLIANYIFSLILVKDMSSFLIIPIFINFMVFIFEYFFQYFSFRLTNSYGPEDEWDYEPTHRPIVAEPTWYVKFPFQFVNFSSRIFVFPMTILVNYLEKRVEMGEIAEGLGLRHDASNKEISVAQERAKTLEMIEKVRWRYEQILDDPKIEDIPKDLVIIAEKTLVEAERLGDIDSPPHDHWQSMKPRIQTASDAVLELESELDRIMIETEEELVKEEARKAIVEFGLTGVFLDNALAEVGKISWEIRNWPMGDSWLKKKRWDEAAFNENLLEFKNFILDKIKLESNKQSAAEAANAAAEAQAKAKAEAEAAAKEAASATLERNNREDQRKSYEKLIPSMLVDSYVKGTCSENQMLEIWNLLGEPEGFNHTNSKICEMMIIFCKSKEKLSHLFDKNTKLGEISDQFLEMSNSHNGLFDLIYLDIMSPETPLFSKEEITFLMDLSGEDRHPLLIDYIIDPDKVDWNIESARDLLETKGFNDHPGAVIEVLEGAHWKAVALKRGLLQL